MGTVVVTGVSPDPEVYGTLAAATAYLTAMFGEQYTTWVALSTSQKGQTLVAATRYMDRLGLVDDDDVAIGHSTTIEDVLFACYELAALIADDPDIQSQLDASSNVQSVNAGGAGVTYFNPSTTASGSATKLPYVVQQLLGDYLPSNAADVVIGGYGQSGGCTSSFSDDEDYDRSDPY